MTYVAGALEIERLFLEPLYRFFSPRSCTSNRRVPPCVRSILNNLADQISHCMHFTCSSKIRHTPISPCVDAQVQSRAYGHRRMVPNCETMERLMSGTLCGSTSLGLREGAAPRNGAVLNKLVTTKFPAWAILVDMAADVTRGIVEWIPREANREADALANGDSSVLNP